jgi:UTP--glucose-1-phosphate uridylyltransferase
VAVDEDNRLRQIVEKPAPEVAPSRLAVVGRYLLTPALESTGRGAGGEIQLTDGIARLLKAEPVFALPFTGRRYDCGSKLGYIEATVDYALADPALAGPLRAHLKSLL